MAFYSPGCKHHLQGSGLSELPLSLLTQQFLDLILSLPFSFFYLFVKIFLLDQELLLMVNMFSKSEVLSLSYVHSFHFVYSSRLFIISCFILEFFFGRECFPASILTFFFNIRTYFFQQMVSQAPFQLRADSWLQFIKEQQVELACERFRKCHERKDTCPFSSLSILLLFSMQIKWLEHHAGLGDENNLWLFLEYSQYLIFYQDQVYNIILIQ